jgi:leader peptidase (prepilin peptidase) / N-methyltransferase
MIATYQEIDAAFGWFFPLLAALLGVCVGSFLNVVIYRVPAGRSVVYPGSACACGRPIAWYDNLPVLSWFLLRGRARCCGARFSFRYPAVELLVGFLFWSAWQGYAPLPALGVMLAIGLLVSASFIDLDTMEIPDVFSIGGFVLGVGLSALVPALHGLETPDPWLLDGMRGFVVSLQGAFVGSGLILWFALIAEAVLRKEAMGMGDVKLMGAIGAFFGWQGAVFALFGGAVIGTLLFLPLMWIWRPKATSPRNATATDEAGAWALYDAWLDDDFTPAPGQIPFGPALAAGALVYALWLHEMVDEAFAVFALEVLAR